MLSDREWLKRLVKLGERFRRTPIVSDDFEICRDEFDACLDCAAVFLAESRPTIVCLCGSTRFTEAFRAANLVETLAGRIVLTVGCDTKSDNDLFKGPDAEAIKVKLDALHMRKIDLCDEIYVLNVGNYIGESTRREIDYAEQQGKRVRYLETVVVKG